MLMQSVRALHTARCKPNTEATINLAIKKDGHTREGRYPESFFARIPVIPMVTSVLGTLPLEQ
jgi:hypothetical protein